jgi:hypothetical protein
LRTAVVRSGTLALALALPAACTGQADGELPCRVYRPQLAKRTFDGRVGAALVFNAGARPVEVRVYHPDGAGDVERRWRVSAGRLLALSGDDGVRLSLGNDWGVQVDDGCVRTLGQSAAWRPGEFALTWTGDSLRAGIDPAR